MHHEWTAPVGVTSIYAHPIEHVFSNMLPPVAGPLLMGSHFATALLFFVLALGSTTISHCGYHFPFLPSPEAHDFHHQKLVHFYADDILVILFVLLVLFMTRPTGNATIVRQVFNEMFLRLSLHSIFAIVLF